MRYVKNLAELALMLSVLAIVSACGAQEPLRTVSDYCLNARVITVEPDPSANDPEREAEDEQSGNQFDTPETTNQVLAHNGVYRGLCPPAGD